VAPDSDVAEADDLVLTLADGDVLDPDVVVSAVAADVVVVRELVVVVAAGGAAVVGDVGEHPPTNTTHTPTATAPPATMPGTGCPISRLE
jgi:hypothetical protein